ncbi:MAG: PTS sugar transporter subunit IIC [Eubacteriales bacterium]|nr:PTS sugar transporter subunit IIC [Eubacteriales bacterium]MDD4326953.1 PTS sugar transporter subunit IIC [Eubacteriales bacterium]MDD4716666.1 PTS sugar transporter subunit IIC [Eubacteriales bacterium]
MDGRKIKTVIIKYLRRYFIDAMSAMAMGLFASLIIGLILKQLFQLTDIGFVADVKEWIKSILPVSGMRKLIETATGASSPLIGAAIGVAVANGLKSKPLAMYSAGIAGAIGYGVKAAGVLVIGGAVSEQSVSAGPVGAFVAAIVAAEIGSLVSGKTKFDILLVPASSILSGTFLAVLIGPGIASFMAWFGRLIVMATELLPLPLGIAVSASMGLALTAPISSAALSIMLGLSGLAAGAATAGCSAHMVGFAVASYRDNKMPGLIAQGVGTSMLQVGNIVKRPQILLPAITASVVTGALSTTVFGMRNIAAGAGMGTSGFVGQFTTWSTMTAGTDALPGYLVLIYMLVLHIVIPAAVALATSEILRRIGWIRTGDMKLEL